MHEVMNAIPKWIKIVFVLVLADVIFLQGMVISFMARISLGIPFMTLSYGIFLLPELIFADGEYHLLAVALFCLFSTFLLRGFLPASARKMVYYWPIICFMTGQAYGLFLYSERIAYIPALHYVYIPFVLIVWPSLLGLLAGTVLKWYR